LDKNHHGVSVLPDHCQEGLLAYSLRTLNGVWTANEVIWGVTQNLYTFDTHFWRDHQCPPLFSSLFSYRRIGFTLRGFIHVNTELTVYFYRER